MHIRPAEREDASQIAEIGKRAFITAFLNEGNREEVLSYLDHIYGLDYVQKRIAQADIRFIVITSDEVFIGFAELNFEIPDTFKGEKCLKLERLYLDPGQIGKGAGAALMKASIELAKKENCSCLWLQVLRSNEAAVNFYESWGFQIFDRSPAKFKADMELDLWMWSEVG
jgi:ribosomal protein S18 acetylase RimI-like enzyme